MEAFSWGSLVGNSVTMFRIKAAFFLKKFDIWFISDTSFIL